MEDSLGPWAWEPSDETEHWGTLVDCTWHTVQIVVMPMEKHIVVLIPPVGENWVMLQTAFVRGTSCLGFLSPEVMGEALDFSAFPSPRHVTPRRRRVDQVLTGYEPCRSR